MIEGFRLPALNCETCTPAEEKSEKADGGGSFRSSQSPGHSHSHPSLSLEVCLQFAILASLLGVWMSVALIFGDLFLVWRLLIEKNVVSQRGMLMLTLKVLC